MRTIETISSWNLPPLTTIERNVLHWLGEGLTIGDLAAALGLTCQTAERHVESILRIFGIEDRAPAVLLRLRAEGCVLEA